MANTFRGLFKVCAEFKTESGIIRVLPQDRLVLREWPIEIQKTLLFRMLLKDGSVEIALGKDHEKQLENAPEENTTPDGKAKKTRKPRAKKETVEETVEETTEEVVDAE